MESATFSTNREVKESRKEPRFPSAGIGDLVIVDPPAIHRASVAIVDLSRSGLQIEAGESLPAGSQVEIRLKDSIVVGKVGHCRPYGEEGRFRIGIVTNCVIESPLQTRHVPEADHLPYVLGMILTEAQRHFYTQHMEVCAACAHSVSRARLAIETPG